MTAPRPPKQTILTRDFFSRSPDVVAPDLLGKLLLHEVNGTMQRGRIIETEAYLGQADPASHAFSRRTAANAVLFDAPGHTHVYLSYGVHHCMSISAHLPGAAGGVLIRALMPQEGTEIMAHRRGSHTRTDWRFLTGGPARVCQALGITRADHDGMDVASRRSPLRIVDDGFTRGTIITSPRVGIQKAKERMLRFQLATPTPRP